MALTMQGRTRPRGGARGTVVTALVMLLIVVSVVGVVLVSQRESRDRANTLFEVRGTASASFVSAYLSQQQQREHRLAEINFGEQAVSPTMLSTVQTTFDARQVDVIDATGRVLGATAGALPLTGKLLSAEQRAARTGRNVIADAGVQAAGSTMVVIVVPFSTPYGNRLLLSTYQMSANLILDYVDRVVPYAEHRVALVDSDGRMVGTDPNLHATSTETLFPGLTSVIAKHPTRPLLGTVDDRVYVVARVSSTPWYLAISLSATSLYTGSSLSSGTFWFVIGVVVLLGAVTVFLQRRQLMANRALRELAEDMRTSALTDPLTGLSNRRHLLEHLERVSTEAVDTGQPYGVLLIDLDQFKGINDGAGHAAGDAVLRAVADCLRQAARPGDVYGRWGGDELMVVVPTAEGNGPLRTAERVLALVESSRPTIDGNEVAFSVSIGCARGTDAAFDDVIRRADVALYRAKASGGGMAAEAGPAGAGVDEHDARPVVPAGAPTAADGKAAAAPPAAPTASPAAPASPR